MPTSFSGKPFCLAKSLQNKMGLSKGGIVQGAIIRGGIVLGVNCPGALSRGGLYGGNCPGASVQGGIVLEPCDLQAHWLLVVIVSKFDVSLFIPNLTSYPGHVVSSSRMRILRKRLLSTD